MLQCDITNLIFRIIYLCYGLITLTETDVGTDSDLDSKPNSYIVLYRNFPLHRLKTQIPTPYSVYDRYPSPSLSLSPSLAMQHYGAFTLLDNETDTDTDKLTKYIMRICVDICLCAV